MRARDTLCRLATNANSKGVDGKWRLIAATVLCTLFMVSRACSAACLLRLNNTNECWHEANVFLPLP